MKLRRHKNIRRSLRFYRLAFDIKDPYHVLVDGTFLTHALQNKVHVKEQLPKMLDGRATPMVTNCVMQELRSLGSNALGAAIIAKGYYRIKCGHDRGIGACACIREQVGNANARKFLVASQDPELQKLLREVPGVPVLRLNGPCPLVEEPSDVSRQRAAEGDAVRLAPAHWEMPKLPELRARGEAAKEAAAAPVKKRKVKGQNPLSCLKSKKVKPTPPRRPVPPQGADALAKTPKRVRSRRMGTRTRAESAELIDPRGANTIQASLAEADAPAPVAARQVITSSSQLAGQSDAPARRKKKRRQT